MAKKPKPKNPIDAFIPDAFRHADLMQSYVTLVSEKIGKLSSAEKQAVLSRLLLDRGTTHYSVHEYGARAILIFLLTKEVLKR